MFKNEGEGEGGVKGRLNNVKKTDDLVLEGVPKGGLWLQNQMNIPRFT